MTPEVVVAISAIEHHAYCPRQCALIHVDGLWEDNAHTVDGVRAHRRADSGRSRQERGRLVLRSIPLWSELLGLTGRADVVEVLADGSVVPVEYKSGLRHGDAADLQLCAQALCLEEMLEVEVPVGHVWYGGPRRRHRVEIDLGLRERTVEVIDSIRSSITTGVLPPAVHDNRCESCQLHHHCLPDLVVRPGAVERHLDWTLRP
ncbi:MAG: CRISPR-associated protein Cas4 [Iamia sp.]